MSSVLVIQESDQRTTTSPGGTMSGLAAPSTGSVELSTWRVSLPAGALGPVHAIDREQVWTLVSGSLAFVVEGESVVAGAGQVAILPAGVLRQVRADSGPAQALVCMRAGGTAEVPGSAERRRLPWAE